MPNAGLLNLDQVRGKLTCITLSEFPHSRDDIGSLDYINFTSKFNSELGFMKSSLEALKNAKTDYVIFCDHDDPFPQKIALPNYGLIYGDFIYRDKNSTIYKLSSKWDYELALSKHWLVHKPIINRELALNLLNNLPLLNLHFHHYFYFLLAYIHGSEYNPQLDIVWNKGNTGMHKLIKNKSRLTSVWLKENSNNIKRTILSL